MSVRLVGKVVETYDFIVELKNQDGYDDLRFRAEIILKPEEDGGNMEVKLWRKEFYRIQPTFPQENGKPTHEASDEIVLVEETGLLELDSSYRDSQSALEAIKKALNDRFAQTKRDAS